MTDIWSVMAALAEQSEQADGPTAKLDDSIYSLFNPGPSFWQRRDDRRAVSLHLYTGSIDAAMTLVPEGAGINIDRYWNGEGARWKCEISTGGVPSDPRQVFDCWDARTAALAICAAALRAQAHKIEEARRG